MSSMSRRDFLRSVGRCAAAGAVGWAGIRLLSQSGGRPVDACRDCERAKTCGRQDARDCPLANPSTKNGGEPNGGQ